MASERENSISECKCKHVLHNFSNKKKNLAGNIRLCFSSSGWEWVLTTAENAYPAYT